MDGYTFFVELKREKKFKDIMVVLFFWEINK